MKTSKAALYALLVSYALLLTHRVAFANDSAFSGVSGTPKPMQGEHRSIAMQSEKVLVATDGKTYDVTVDFIFRNDGAATTVQMGFPENSYGDVEATKKPTFLSFETSVDDQKVVARRHVITTLEDGIGIEAYWLKTVHFGARQTRHVRVAYRAPMGGNTMWGTHVALVYDFTGQNWKGKVERSDLEVHVKKPGLWIAMPLFDDEPLTMDFQNAADGAVFRKTWRNWQAQGTFMFGLTAAVPYWMNDRTRLMVSESAFAHARTFRVGPVPKELPTNAEAPAAFVRGDTTYISLAHLEGRLEDFAADLDKYRHRKPEVGLKWDAKSGISNLAAGTEKFSFPPGVGPTAPILLGGEYGGTLYVPLAPIAQKLGLEVKTDLPHRIFDLKRGTWTGQ